MKKIFLLMALLLMGSVQTLKAQNETNDCGTLIIPTIFDDVKVGENGLFAVVKDKKCGVLNSDGTILIPIQYDGVGIGDYGEDCGGLIVVRNNFEKQIEEVGLESVNRYTVTESVDGLINKEGVQLVPMGKYKHIYLKNKGLVKVTIEINEVSSKDGALLKDGTLITSYDRLSVESGGLIIVERNRLKGVLNENGEVIVPIQYDDVTIRDGLIRVNTPYQNGSQKFGIFNDKGKTIVPIGKYESGSITNSYIEVKKNKQKGILNSNGVEIAPIGMYANCYIRECNERNQYYVEIESNNKKGALNDNGKVFIPIGKYDDFRVLNKNLASVTLNKKTGIVNNNGGIIVPIGKYERISYQYGMLVYYQNGKFGIIDKNGNQATMAEYNFINPARHSTGLAFVVKEGKRGVINCDGKTIVPLGNYEDGKINGDIGFLKSDEGTMFFNRDGKILAPIGKYEKCMQQYGVKILSPINEEGLFKVEKDNKYGVVKLW